MNKKQNSLIKENKNWLITIGVLGCLILVGVLGYYLYIDINSIKRIQFCWSTVCSITEEERIDWHRILGCSSDNECIAVFHASDGAIIGINKRYLPLWELIIGPVNNSEFNVYSPFCNGNTCSVPIGGEH
ncbi:Uncharacterised protein [Candidatus Tiddalikarchaeum anstoanum]|nr:Uncharacterised protein [Candidatus Tiddalikarchaeum anstoanum]